MILRVEVVVRHRTTTVDEKFMNNTSQSVIQSVMISQQSGSQSVMISQSVLFLFFCLYVISTYGHVCIITITTSPGGTHPRASGGISPLGPSN